MGSSLWQSNNWQAGPVSEHFSRMFLKIVLEKLGSAQAMVYVHMVMPHNINTMWIITNM